jgi:hypothetical protein
MFQLLQKGYFKTFKPSILVSEFVGTLPGLDVGSFTEIGESASLLEKPCNAISF